MNWNRLFVVSLLAFFGCRQQTSFERPTYSNQALTDSLRLAIGQAWKNVNDPDFPKGVALNGPWQFVQGTAEKLTRTADPHWTEAEEVVLPNRVDLPNTALWYRLVLQESVPPSVLSLHADDGAQAFLQGRQLLRVSDDKFWIAAFEGDTLDIRVLNNAMAGGLAKAMIVEKSAFEDWQKRVKHQRKLEALVTHASKIDSPPNDFLQKVLECVQSPSDEKLQEALAVIGHLPYLSRPVLMESPDGLVYQWLGTRPGAASLWAGKTPDLLTFNREINSEGLIFRLKVSDLPEGEVFGLRQNETETEIFPTPLLVGSPDTTSFSFNFWADSQGGWQVFSQLMKNTLVYNDSFSIGAGDLVANGADSVQWKNLLGSLGEAGGRFPFYLVPGNHDYDGYYDDLVPRNFSKYVVTPSGKNYFSWQYGNCAFIAIDPNNSFPIGFHQGEQYEWFLNEIQSEQWKQATWHFVVLHQPPFSQGWPGYHGDQVVRDLLTPYYQNADVDFVIAGHTHDYERLTKTISGKKVNFLIVGGGGGGLEPGNEMSDYPVMDTVIRRHHLARMYVAGDSIHLEVRGIDDQIIDKQVFIKE